MQASLEIGGVARELPSIFIIHKEREFISPD